MGRFHVRVFTAFGLTAALLACRGAPPMAVAASTASPSGAAAPDTAAGRQLAWVLASMAVPPGETAAAEHFTPEFLAKVPMTKMVGIFAEVAPGAPFTLQNVSVAAGSRDRLVAIVGSRHGPGHTIRLAIDPSSGRIGTLFVRRKVDPPDTPAGHQLAWVVAAIGATPSETDVASHFTPDFLAQASAAQVAAILRQAASGAPFILETASASKASPDEIVAVVHSSAGPRLTVRLGIDPASGRMAALLLQPKVDVPTKRAQSWDEVLAGLRDVAPSVNFLAAEVDAGKCIPVASLAPQKPLALGSAFKLYVLDALATQVASGKHAWEEVLPIQDAQKSLPSGAMRDEAAGKTFSVRHFAEQMISVSDNTAADHVLALVGRLAVEDAVKASGHATPARVQPFLTTRELFALKLLASPDERAAYVSADISRKRSLLESYDARDLTPALTGPFLKPVMIDSIEWFASPEDLCKVMADLQTRAGAPATAPVAAILSLNPGIPDEGNQYTYVGYKGGSEPGVLNLTWLLRRARDGKWLFLTAGFNDADAAIDQAKVLAAVSTAREFLGR